MLRSAAHRGGKKRARRRKGNQKERHTPKLALPGQARSLKQWIFKTEEWRRTTGTVKKGENTSLAKKKGKTRVF